MPTTRVNSKSEVLNSIVKRLNQVYPRAISYIELWDHALNGVPASQRGNMRGGTVMRRLVKQGVARQISTGYYVAHK